MIFLGSLQTWTCSYYQNFECKSLFQHFWFCLFSFKTNKKKITQNQVPNKQTKKNNQKRKQPHNPKQTKNRKWNPTKTQPKQNKSGQNPLFLVIGHWHWRLPLSSNFTSFSVSILNLEHSAFSTMLLFSAFLNFLVVFSHQHLSLLNVFFLKQRTTEPLCSPLPPKTGRDLCHYEIVISFFLSSVEVNFKDCSSRPNCKVHLTEFPSPAHSLHIA